MSAKAYFLSPAGDVKHGLSEEEIIASFESSQGLLWVDITDIGEADVKFLEQGFHFHQLAIEDAVSPEQHHSKVDDFEDYLFIMVHGINYMAETDIVETAELAIFLGNNFVVSVHNLPLQSIDAIRSQVDNNGRPMRQGTYFLAHAIIDTLVDNVLPIIDRMSEMTDDVEENAIRRPQQATLEAILKLKRSTLRIHRVMSPQRDVLNRLSRGDYPIIKEEARIFYRDIYDHLIRIEDLNQAIRDRTDNALATYLSSMANRQNETMRVLSMVATIFLPLTLLAGIYGMNFENMPELSWPWGYFAVLGVIAAVILILLWWFWARNWITWGRRQAVRITSLVVDPEKLIGSTESLAKLKDWYKKKAEFGK